ncbi:uncharacterized protein LOC106656455 isoform X2 [Trichogramma pretiosum]|uniref:uncharacterized protein LOC106656455 isoform X2 n=1 Tax=Trichogramma pretiosum TaxID=7493 RepID=UPI0006C99BD7|nr:uncharacterized protein LOC106656455 isoform X2 [Trichogramma pretiosum]
MACKEMMIVFVYDTARCCKEEDDPADALVYFHPAWVSPTQRLALASQLMGVQQFLSTNFSPPSMITLQGGKFVLRRFKSYTLAVGTDRNIQDWILKRRAVILDSLLKFFHCDFDTISASFNNDRNKFTEKLYQIFETYLPILQYSANLFANLPLLKLPRSASNVFLEAMQIIQYCQETNGILGGALFYNNKVVASQLNTALAKQLVITDPYRIKAPADRVATNFQLPAGVQLLRVFIEQKQLSRMIVDANLERGHSANLDSATTRKANNTKKKAGSKEAQQQQQSSQQQQQQQPPPPISMMKRDTSRIFTVPEDAELDATHYNMTQCIPSLHHAASYNSPSKRAKESTNSGSGSGGSGTEPASNGKPKYVHPLTPSVCSTPLKDVNRVLHDFVVSICATSEENENPEATTTTTTTTTTGHADEADAAQGKCSDVDDIPDVVKEALRQKRMNKLRQTQPREQLMLRARERNVVSLSLTNLVEQQQLHHDGRETAAKSTRNMSSCPVVLRSYGIGMPKMNFDEDDDETAASRSTKKQRGGGRRRVYNTIADPFHLVFRSDGLPVSRALYDDYIASHYKELDRTACRSELAATSSSGAPPATTTRIIASTASSLPNPKSVAESDSEKDKSAKSAAAAALDAKKSRQESCKRSMSLPLKPLSSLTADQDDDDASAGNPRRKSACSSESSGVFELGGGPPTGGGRRAKLEGLQLTPLMSKLSLLADERTSGFCSRDTTPSEFRDPLSSTYSLVSSSAAQQAVRSRLEALHKECCSDNDDDDEEEESTDNNAQEQQQDAVYERAELFLCGYQNMVMFLLMEDGTGNDADLIHGLWETCAALLSTLELRLQQCLEQPLPANESKELYSVLSVDSEWDTTYRSGLWGVTELDLVSSIHDRFKRNNNVTDVTIRTEDTVVYGNRCGNHEVFYQQAVPHNTLGGLPTPADLMGIVPLKAKRRLERDHSIVML